jgi:hypothetical protein
MKVLKYSTIFFYIIVIFLSNSLYGKYDDSKPKLSDNSIKSFHNYISSKRKRSDKFMITLDGTGTYTWVCPQTLCLPAGENFYAKPCKIKNKNKKCKIFAVGRKIKWSSVNTTLNEYKTFKQSDSFIEVIQKLQKLGFVD